MRIPSTLSTRRRRLAAVAAASGLALALTACTGGDGGSSNGGSSEGITVFNGATGTFTANFNPFSPSALQPTLGVVYESLYYYNLAADVDPKPMLATGFSWNEDGTQLTITTREGVQWSDGEPFTAADVAYTFNLITATPALNASGLDVSAEAVDDTTAVLTFPQTSFVQEPQILGQQAIIAEHQWSQFADPTTETNPEPVGTGPYQLDSLNNQSYLLNANENYWQGAPAIPSVRYISLANADAATAALTSGQVDWISSFLPGLEQLLADQPELSYVNTPALTTSILTCAGVELGCTGPQTDPAVRQAMYYAIDRDQLNRLAGGGFAQTASPTLLLPERDQRWIADQANLTTPAGADTDRANQILDEAGWVRGGDGIRTRNGERLTMSIQTVTGYSDFISLNDAMTQQMAAVGIELQPTQLSYNEWNNNQVQGQYQLSLDSIGLGASSNPFYTYNPRYNTAQTAPVGTAAANAGNYARYSNPAVDQALAVAAATNDEAVQTQQYAAIQDEILRDMPYVPIYINSTLTEFNTSRATGWPTNDDPYAFAATWKSWDNGQVLYAIQPAE